MRTTVDLDEDVLAAAKALAAAERRSLGKVVSDLMRRGLAPRTVVDDDELFPVIRVGPGASPITAEKVRAALDEAP
ncbi:MAG: antitoxin [Acidimicrobiia bacterium]